MKTLKPTFKNPFAKRPAPFVPPPPTLEEKLQSAEKTVEDALSSFKSAAQRIQVAKQHLEVLVKETSEQIAQLEANKQRAQSNVAKFEGLRKRLEEFTI